MIHLITGASASGKSAYAEEQAAKLNRSVYYVATMHKDGSQELNQRILRHQKIREYRGFETIEKEQNIGEIRVSSKSTVLVECLSNLLANEIFLGQNPPFAAADKIRKDIETLAGKCENMVLVTNEVFSDGVQYSEEMKEYVRALADLNCRLAKRADWVTEVVYTIPLEIKR